MHCKQYVSYYGVLFVKCYDDCLFVRIIYRFKGTIKCVDIPHCCDASIYGMI